MSKEIRPYRKGDEVMLLETYSDLIPGDKLTVTDTAPTSNPENHEQILYCGDYSIESSRVKLVHPSIQSPIRTRTVTEIVPGEYGPVSVRIYERDPSDHVRLSLFAKDEMYRALDAAELREAARIFISLAEALEENAK